jgi:hypothetical protein
MESLNIGPCPADEVPAQLGTAHYRQLARLELQLFRQQLTEEVANNWPEEGCLVYFKTTSNPHDFGTYFDLDVVYNPTNPISRDQAYYCECKASPVWTPERRQTINTLRQDLGLDPLTDPSQEPA